MLTTPDGFRYEGGWKAGEIDGEGTATYANGDVYTGSFVAGKRQGAGVMRYASGRVAEGQWNDDRLQQSGAAAESQPSNDDAQDAAVGDAVVPEAVPADPSEATAIRDQPADAPEN